MQLRIEFQINKTHQRRRTKCTIRKVHVSVVELKNTLMITLEDVQRRAVLVDERRESTKRKENKHDEIT